MMRQNEEILMIVDKTDLEVIEDRVDKYPCLSFRKFIMKARLYYYMNNYLFRVIVIVSGKIITHPLFEYFYLLVIISNSIFLALDDPTLSDS